MVAQIIASAHGPDFRKTQLAEGYFRAITKAALENC